MGSIMVNPGLPSSGAVTISDESDVAGRLYVPPAFMQTTGDAAIALASANHAAAMRFVPEVDFELSSLSAYITAISVTGNLTITVHDDGAATEANGLFNRSNTNSAPAMTANNAPSPKVVAAVDSAGNNGETVGFEAYRAMDASSSADNGFRSNAAPSGGAPIVWAIDFGAGNTKIINKFRFVSFNNSDANVRAYPKAFTLWGSNVASPVLHTDSDWTQITGDSTWTVETDPGVGKPREYCVNNAVSYRHYRWKITDRNGTNSYLALSEIQVFEADQQAAPGSLLASLGALAAGGTPDVWVRKAGVSYQLQRGKADRIKFAGEASKNISLSKRRLNTSVGSTPPDTCLTKESTDGTNWSTSTQNSRPACLNVIINSTTNHVPQLLFGRYSGSKVNLFVSGAWTAKTIPASGILLNLGAHNAPDATYGYRVLLYDSGGTLTLSAEKVGLSLQDGIEVKESDASKRYLGLVYPVERLAGFWAAIDCEDFRAVNNRHNRLPKMLGKRSPYAAWTYWKGFDTVWRPWNDNDDYLVKFVADGISPVRLTMGVALYCGPNDAINVAIGVDSRALPAVESSRAHVGPTSGYLHIQNEYRGTPAQGLHYLVPLIYGTTNHSYTEIDYFRSQTNQEFLSELLGTLIC